MRKKISVGIGILMLIGLVMPCFAQSNELEEKVPEAKGYTILYKFNPIEFGKGYTVDKSQNYTGELKRIAYYLKTVDKEGKESWVFVSMDPFTQDLHLLYLRRYRQSQR